MNTIQSKEICTICLEDFTGSGIQAPMSVTCGHSFCNRCVEELEGRNVLKQLNTQGTSKINFDCPICRRHTASAGPNILARQLLEKLEEKEKEKIAASDTHPEPPGECSKPQTGSNKQLAHTADSAPNNSDSGHSNSTIHCGAQGPDPVVTTQPCHLTINNAHKMPDENDSFMNTTPSDTPLLNEPEPQTITNYEKMYAGLESKRRKLLAMPWVFSASSYFASGIMCGFTTIGAFTGLAGGLCFGTINSIHEHDNYKHKAWFNLLISMNNDHLLHKKKLSCNEISQLESGIEELKTEINHNPEYLIKRMIAVEDSAELSRQQKCVPSIRPVTNRESYYNKKLNNEGINKLDECLKYLKVMREQDNNSLCPLASCLVPHDSSRWKTLGAFVHNGLT